MKISRFLLAVGLSFAISTFSCSSDDGDDNGGNNWNSGNGTDDGGGSSGNGGGSNTDIGGGSNTMYTLMVNVSPSGAGTVSPAQASYAPGTQATVRATPASGYTFSHWSGTSTSTSNPLSITMNNDKTLTAVFEQVANAIFITLTSWESTETDGWGSRALDPRIYFKVIAKNGNTTVSSNNTSDLLYADDIGQSWSGSKKSSAIPFVSSATAIQIHAVVIERDALFDDDISPGYYFVFDPPFYVGRRGTETLDYGTGKSKVSFNYEFVWQ